MTTAFSMASTNRQEENLEVIEVTPEKAMKFLATQGPQRRQRPHKIEQYASDMKSGKWEFNAAPLMFDTHGRMRDGQNRMAAFLKAGVPSLRFAILRNASEATIATVDTGMSRTFADVTRMQGIPNATAIAAAASAWWKYDNKAMSRQDRPSHQQLEVTRNAHLNSLDTAIKMVNRFNTARKLTGNSPLIFVLAYLFERDPKLAENYGLALDSGLNLTAGDPMVALRRTLTNNLGSRGKMNPTIVTALLIKTFNFQYTGRRVQNVMYRKGERFPEFVV